ncbi:MAG: D-2-hydroxyacid dehydrogenase [Acidobacteriota bacterium]|nr:MAG: D-2-hydroxyacid dehydrogenase [Acidobacteriota bacterium]
MTRRLYRQAAKRNPRVASQVKCTIATDKEGFYRAIGKADVLVGWWFPKYELADIAPNLKWIHVIGAGIEHLLPLDWLPKSVRLVNNTGVHAAKAGEYVMMALLMLQNAIPSLVTQQRQKKWQEIYSTTIGGKTLLIIGVGNMGGAAAKKAKELGLHVIGVRRTPRARRNVDEMYAVKDLRKLIPRADFVLITSPLTTETRGLMGKRELDLMRPEASLINFGRAEIVDYNVLRKKLIRGEIKGAVLDVFEREPLPKTSPLWSTPNLIITPHVGSDDAEAYIPFTLDLALENAGRYLAGRPLENRVIPSREY